MEPCKFIAQDTAQDIHIRSLVRPSEDVHLSRKAILSLLLTSGPPGNLVHTAQY